MADQKQQRSTGKVLWFNDSKGFGFIRPDDGKDDLFVHHSSINSDGFRSLAVDAAVEFSVSEGNGGKTQAVEVTPIGRKDQRLGRRSEGCYTCGDLNHIARDCDKGRSYGRGGDAGAGEGCYNCGAAGHFARDCRRESNEGNGGGGGGKCYNCGKFGHFARDCNDGGVGGGRNGPSGSECYTCGGIGHLARDCPSQRRVASGGGSGRGCFNCGKEGHVARDCRETKAAA